MKAIKILLAMSALSCAGIAGAATTYNVTYSFESPGTALVGTTIDIPSSGGGSGTAILDGNGVLQMTLHGEQFGDYSTYYGWPQAYADTIQDTIVQLMTTSSGGGVYNLVQAGSFIQYNSCVNGPLDSLDSCSFVPAGATYSAYGSDDFYTAQSFTLNGGIVKVITNGFGVTFTTDYTLTAVPLPASVWMFGSGLVGLVGVSRRRNPAK